MGPAPPGTAGAAADRLATSTGRVARPGEGRTVKFSFLALARQALRGHAGWPEQWRSPAPRPAYDAVIVGAGGHGLATAYYMAKEHGMRDIAVLEKGWLGGGNTGRNTTIIRSNYLWEPSAALYGHAHKLWPGCRRSSTTT